MTNLLNKENLIYLSLDDIKPYSKNPRNNKDAVPFVINSIKEFGFKNPIILDKDNVIICGHTRYEAAKKLNLKEVPCVIAADLTPKQVKAFRLADNKVSEVADWDFDLLNEELSDLVDDFDMGDFNFDVMSDEESKEIIEDDAPEVDINNEPTAKLGQVWKLGRHRLMCGDSTKPDDVAKLMNGAKADIVVTDPPYNVDYEGGTGLKIENDKWDDEQAFHDFLLSAFVNFKDALKPGGAFYIWYANMQSVPFITALKDTPELHFSEYLIWNKNSLVLGRNDYQWKHEPCLYGWKEGASHLWAADRKQTTVIDWDRPTKSELHPTMKPVGLFDYQIKNNTKGGDIVLDLFGGSGTTIMACEQNGRCGYLMEYDPHYVDVIIKRWETYTGEKAELLQE